MKNYGIPFLDRVEMVPFSTCWYWIGAVGRNGYGKVRRHGKVRSSHRVSYEMHNGPIPDGLHVCHKCDVKICVNPDHLFLGNQADNMKDMLAKGRKAPSPCFAGEAHGMAKLTDENIREIRAKRMLGQTQSSIAAEYGVSRSHISAICLRKNWRAA